MSELDIRARRQLRKAKNLASAGKRSLAEEMLRAFTQAHPKSAAGWLALADVVRDEDEQASIYNTVLELDPSNAMAQAALGHGAADVPSGSAAETFDDVPADESEAPVGDNGTASSFEAIAARIKAEAEARRAAEAAERERRQKAFEAALPRERPAPPPTPETEHDHEAEETDAGLRCYRCGIKLEPTKAIPTPVGYTCAKCKRELEQAYFTAQVMDYLIALVTTIPLSALAAFLLGFLLGGIGFFTILITLFIAPTVGTLIASMVFRAVGRRRGRYLAHLVAGGIVFGAVIAWLLGIGWLSVGLYAFMAASASYYRLRS
jgi:hypothetical protein